MRRSAAMFLLMGAWLAGVEIVESQAQPLGSRRTSGGSAVTSVGTLTQAANPSVYLPDLVGELSTWASIESYTAENPCVPHTHDITRHLSVKNPTTRPATGSIHVRLRKQGTQVAQWTIPAPGPGVTDPVGRFQYVYQHNCPDGGITVSQPPTPNYQLEFDTTNVVNEWDENNVYSFYMDPAVSFQPE